MRTRLLHKRLGGSRRWWFIAIAALAAAACSDNPLALDDQADLSANGAERGDGVLPGAVYLMSNAAAGNEILVFDRSAEGELTAADPYPTGGNGTGGGLGNQASLVLTKDNLYAVNAGSHDISVFRVGPRGLDRLGAPVASGGNMPISLTVHGNLLYVLNAGGSGNITGFRLATNGRLTPIPGSTRPLSSDAAGPAQIQFSPDGRVLIVTEKATNTITTYLVGYDGVAGQPTAHASAGQTPFGFNFNRRGYLIVSEAVGGAADASTVSSYRVGRFGNLRLVSGTVATTQTAACWIVVSPDGRFAFTTNTGSGTISSLRIDYRGRLSLVDAAAGVTGDGSLPQDAAFTPGGRFLYVRNAAGTVSAFEAGPGGALTHVGDFGPLPDGANGIAAR